MPLLSRHGFLPNLAQLNENAKILGEISQHLALVELNAE
jgi:hypothetical protein